MLLLWAGFIAFVLTLMALDIYVFHRRSHAVGMKKALVESGIWVALALCFSLFIYAAYQHHWYGLGLPGRHHPHGASGARAVTLFITGYLLEESLSVDNLFVMAIVFGYFAIPAKYQHRVLFWGIIGAELMRGAMIGMGAALVSHFQWILYGFGVFLLYTAWKMLYSHANPSPENNLILKFARRNLPVTDQLRGPHFIVVESGEERVSEARSRERRRHWMLTPLALALLMVETTDLLFALDSIPATFGVTTDPFLVFTSNIFAVLGLRAMYFALAGVLRKFRYLSVSLAAVLAVVGLKMLARPLLKSVHHSSYWLLGIIVLLLGAGVIASVLKPRDISKAGPTT